MNETIKKVIFTLGLVEVHGAENLSRLLGCIQALQSVIEEEEKNG